jgi:ankyrin repeat protein
MVYVLLEKKVNVNAPGARIGGRTAIEGAAEHGRVGVLELLLECGGVKIVGDGEDQYQRALTFADKNGHRKAKFMLEQAKEKSRKKVVANEVPLGLM